MSNDYFKAQGWFKDYARNSQDSRGMFQRLVKEDEREFKIASAETDRIKAMINKKYGPGSIKYGSEIPQPPARPEVIEMDLINAFTKRNPAAEGGQMVKPSDDGSRPGYNGQDQKKSNVKKYPNLVKEYDKIISEALENENLKDVKSFQQFLKEKNVNPKAFSEWKRKGNTSIKTSLIDARISLARTLVDKANNGNKVVYIADIAPKLNLSWMGTNTLFNKNELALDSPKTKAIRVFNEFMTRESAPAKEMFNMVSQMADEVGISRGSFSNIMKDYPDYIESRRLFKNLATPSSKKWILNNPGATFADVIDKVEGRQFRENLLGNIRSGKSSAEHKIMLYAARHERQGGSKIEFINRAGLDKNGNILDYRDIEFIYKEDPNNPKTWSKWDYDRILTEGAQSDIFKDIYKAEADLNRMLSTVVKDPRTGKDISFGKLMTDTYSTEGGHTFGFRRTPYEIDHMDSVLNDPFKNVRILPRRINQILGQVKNQANIATTPGTGMKMKNIVKYIGKNKEQILNTIDPNFANIQSIDDLINSELATSNRVFETLKRNPELKGKVFKSSKELFNEITSMGDRAGPIDINFRTSNLDPVKNIDYIGGQGGTTLSSGFNTDLLMKDPAVQKILNSKAGQAIKNAAKGTAGTVGKVFGVADILIGVLDYENNISKGQKPNEALGNAVQAMSFGLYKSGDRARIADVKERFVAKGGDGEIFDQATALNAKDQEINDLIYKSKFTADKAFMDLSQPQAILGKSVDQRKQDYEILKQSLNEKIRDAIAERDNMIESYKTNLRVSEAGAPIQIGGQEFFSQPFKDIKQSTMEKIEEENKKAYDMQKRQLVPTAGNIGNWILTNVMTMDPIEKAKMQKYINEMDERELYKFNLERGMDPDNLIRFEDILRYKTEAPELMGVNTTKYINKRDQKSEGGITGLRSKYEYKK